VRGDGEDRVERRRKRRRRAWLCFNLLLWVCVAITIAVFARRWFGNRAVLPLPVNGRKVRIGIVGECSLYFVVGKRR
jgi:hypothetical protein